VLYSTLFQGKPGGARGLGQLHGVPQLLHEDAAPEDAFIAEIRLPAPVVRGDRGPSSLGALRRLPGGEAAP
jgi:hypothetical protein